MVDSDCQGRLHTGEVKLKKLLTASYHYGAGRIERIPWALELYFLCQQYNKLPTASNILDEDPYLLYAMDNAIAGYRFAEKKLKDYSEEDHKLDRMIKVQTMIMDGVDKDYFRRKIDLMCGGGVFDDDEVNTERLKEMGLTSNINEIVRYASI